MKRSLFVLFTLLLIQCGYALADVYVSPEEHRAWAKEGLEKQLAEVPENKQVQFVQQKLKEMPLKRQELEMKVKMAEAAAAKGDHSGPPAYFLRKGFEGFDYEEEALKNWLAAHGHPVKPGKKTEKGGTPKPSATSGALPQHPSTTHIDSASSAPAPPASSASLVALMLLAAGGLLGLRRALA